MFANFYSIFQRAAATAGEIPLRLARLCAFVAPLAFLGLAPTVKRADASALLVRRFVKIWFGVACFGVLAFGTYFRHYALPIFLPGAIASATAFDSTARIRRLAFGILAIAIIIGQLMLAELRRTEGSPIRRIGHQRWLRNLAVALGNALRAMPDAQIEAALRARLPEASALLGEHIEWALRQGQGACSEACSVSHSGRLSAPSSVDTVTSPATKEASPPMRAAST